MDQVYQTQILDTETKKFQLIKKYFKDLKVIIHLKKSELEVKQADLKLKKIEQQTILDTVSAYFDLYSKQK